MMGLRSPWVDGGESPPPRRQHFRILYLIVVSMAAGGALTNIVPLTGNLRGCVGLGANALPAGVPQLREVLIDVLQLQICACCPLPTFPACTHHC